MRGRGHSWTLIRPSVSSQPASIGPLILWARLSLLLQSLLSSLVVTLYSRCKGCVAFFFFFFPDYAEKHSASWGCVSRNNVCRVKRYPEEKDNHPRPLWALFLETPLSFWSKFFLVQRYQHNSSPHLTVSSLFYFRFLSVETFKERSFCSAAHMFNSEIIPSFKLAFSNNTNSNSLWL